MPVKHNHTTGRRQSPTYRAWAQMLVRHRGQKDSEFYADRGITVCERWHTFEHFLEDMGPKPDEALTLERENNAGNYEPGNCTWATRARQSQNRRSTKLTEFEVRGIRASTESRQTLAARYGVSEGTIDSVRAKRTWRNIA